MFSFNVFCFRIYRINVQIIYKKIYLLTITGLVKISIFAVKTRMTSGRCQFNKTNTIVLRGRDSRSTFCIALLSGQVNFYHQATRFLRPAPFFVVVLYTIAVLFSTVCEICIKVRIEALIHRYFSLGSFCVKVIFF
jgi:hypothetical protein